MKAFNLGKIIGIVISASLLASLSVSSVSAGTSFTAGDSIATGVTPVVEERATFNSFAVCVDQYLQNSGLTDGGSSVAKLGATSSEILDQVKNAGTIDDAKYVMISSGGNDLLDLLEEALIPYMEEGDTLATLTPEKTAALTQKISADQTAFMDKLSGVTLVTEEAAKNASAIVAAVKEKNPDAEIYFLEMFNPFDTYTSADDDTLKLIGNFADTCIRSYNRKLAAIDGIHLVPVFSNFEGHGNDFIRPNDVHPTDAGHVRIAELIIGDITGEEDSDILLNMAKYKMISIEFFMDLPKDMTNPAFAALVNLDGTTTAVTTEEPTLTTNSSAFTTSVTETTTAGADTTVPLITSPVSASESNVTTSLNDQAGAVTTSVSVTGSEVTTSPKAPVSIQYVNPPAATNSNVSATPSTSDRGISPVVISGLFSAAAVCMMARKKKD